MFDSQQASIAAQSAASGTIWPGEIVMTGDGDKVPTTNPPPKLWYQNGFIWAGGILGFLSGGAFFMRRR